MIQETGGSEISHLYSVMKKNHSTGCTKKCHYKEHVKEAQIYVIKTKTEKRTYETLNIGYKDTIVKGASVVKRLEEELKELERENKAGE